MKPTVAVDHVTGTVTISKLCAVTGKLYSVTVSQPRYVGWLGGNNMIQDAFPELSSDDREFLISGSTPAEWDKMFGDEE